MRSLALLHQHPRHRSRQLRWIVPLVAMLLGAALLTLAVQYVVGGQDVSTEFFRAHKTIHNTAQLLRRGFLLGSGVLLLAAVGVGAWALRLTHAIVRPVHTLHRALDALTAGDLGVRVELHRHDEFQEVGDALNRLVDELGAALAKVHALADRVAELSAQLARDPHDEATRALLQRRVGELDRTLDFFRLEPRRVIREERA